MASSKSLLSSLFLFSVTLALLTCSCMAGNTLQSPGTLPTGASLNQGSYTLTMQGDCNLVLYAPQAIWASGSNGKGGNCNAAMQSDGNLVVYNGNGNAVWASNTNRARGSFRLVLQADRNLVIYDNANGRAIWATNTNVAGSPNVVIARAPGNTTEVAASKKTVDSTMVPGNK